VRRLARLASASGRGVALLLLPLSTLPFLYLTPKLVGGHRSFAHQYFHREPLPAPQVSLTPAQLAKFRPPRTFRGAVPVLAYHGIADRADGQSITRRQFTAQMTMLAAAGFHPISIAQYVLWPGGSARELPSRPILITFDDGRLDSYRGAERALERFRFRATMFIDAAEPEAREPFYLRWDELQRMHDSGRWDVQLHAGAGHNNIAVDAGGNVGPAYAFRRFLPERQRLESLTQWRSRVTGDVERGARLLSSRLRGVQPLAFAVPFSNYGQDSTNDRRIARFLEPWLHLRFPVVFIAGRPTRPPAGVQRTLRRLDIGPRTSAERLYAWLARDPGRARHRAAASTLASRSVVRPPHGRLLGVPRRRPATPSRKFRPHGDHAILAALPADRRGGETTSTAAPTDGPARS